ncbi:hypothetical protein TNIN_114401 [Trichonephila inaurata madagascariensis]|uniref:Uncharacterized protein n=1 Tax=Trichonephila inaurata madagascariensis TaxID=2747483 RepID=A0A8X6MJC4_9ARAC|nr:hypothetical protein TNIN_114401 [Trichonephila inaurata madagascariensis]
MWTHPPSDLSGVGVRRRVEQKSIAEKQETLVRGMTDVNRKTMRGEIASNAIYVAFPPSEKLSLQWTVETASAFMNQSLLSQLLPVPHA